MKYYYLLLCIIAIHSGCYSQERTTFVHPTENYEIEIPEGWTYKRINESNLCLINQGTSPLQFFSLFVTKSDTQDLEESYNYFIQNLSGAEGFKL